MESSGRTSILDSAAAMFSLGVTWGNRFGIDWWVNSPPWTMMAAPAFDSLMAR